MTDSPIPPVQGFPQGSPLRYQWIQENFGSETYKLHEAMMDNPSMCRLVHDYSNWIKFENGCDEGILQEQVLHKMKITVYGFNIVNWFLLQHTNIPPMFDSESGIHRSCEPTHAKRVGKAILSLTERNPEFSSKLQDAFLDHFASKNYWEQNLKRESCELSCFANFCLASSGFRIYPEYRNY